MWRDDPRLLASFPQIVHRQYVPKCLSVNKLNDLSDLCFGARREIGAADVDQREPRSLRPEQASLPK